MLISFQNTTFNPFEIASVRHSVANSHYYTFYVHLRSGSPHVFSADGGGYFVTGPLENSPVWQDYKQFKQAWDTSVRIHHVVSYHNLTIPLASIVSIDNNLVTSPPGSPSGHYFRGFSLSNRPDKAYGRPFRAAVNEVTLEDLARDEQDLQELRAALTRYHLARTFSS